MRGNVGCLALVVLALVACVGIGIWGSQYEYGTEHDVTFKIAQVTNIATGSSGHEYDIYTGKGQVLMNADSLMHGKFDSATVQAWLSEHQGQTVICPVYGYRVPVLSSKMNILDGCKVATTDAVPNY